MSKFELCCEYLGISSELPKCQIDEKQFQAAYKLRVCMKAWNKEDGFEPDENAICLQSRVGFNPFFFLFEGELFPAEFAYSGSISGVIRANADPSGAFSTSNFGLRIVLSSEKRAVAFSRAYIDIFNELL